ncbi:MAG: mechanosensitive ion channel protein MscS [Crocinitomicaceae bacterium]|jgi:small-conductance mechanosensitive channel|nr:mechanosensitive ion channel protein MscS [Crocinitomicaceae bacterium]
MFQLFKGYEHQIFLTIIVLACWLMTRFLTKRAIKKLSIKFGIAIERRRITVKILNIIFVLLTVVFIITIWGVNKNQLFLFFTSIITVLGIGFFAQWSILANITSGIIIFFSHPIKLGQKVKFVDKDFDIEGRLVNISFFYMHLENDKNEKITIPNSVALQKTIVIEDH